MIEPARTDLVQHDTVRLISTARLKEPVLLALAPNHGAMEDLAELEGATSGRLQAQEGGLLDLDPRELAFGRPGHSFINAAFTYTRPGGNRFNDDERGAWYCAFLSETALAEVSFHLSRELEAINRFENATDYAELLADFVGQFHDLRGEIYSTNPCLSADPDVAYPAGQAMAKLLRKDRDSPGLIYPSVRSTGGTCLVAFHPSLVQNLRQGSVWRLEWQGSGHPEISKLWQQD